MFYICRYRLNTEKNGSFICCIFLRWNKMSFKHTKICDSGMQFINVWILYIPKFRILKCQIQVCSIRSVRVDLHFLFPTEKDFITSVFCEKYFYKCHFIF